MHALSCQAVLCRALTSSRELLFRPLSVVSASKAAGIWVPPAYRGVKKDRKARKDGKFDSSWKAGKKKINHHRKIKRSDSPAKKKYAQSYVTDKARVTKKNFGADMKRMRQSCSNWVDQIEEYKQKLDLESPRSDIPKLRSELAKQQWRFVVDLFRAEMLDIHAVDSPITWTKLLETDDVVREMLRTLQDIVVFSTHLARMAYQMEARRDYSLIAEAALRCLISLRSERTLLAASAKNWSLPKRGSTKSWVSRIFEGFGGEDENGQVERIGLLAHEDASLGASRNLFQAVMESIAVSVSTGVDGGDEMQAQIAEIEEASNRLINLLEVHSPSSAVSPDMYNIVFDTLMKEHSLEGARKSVEFYIRYQRRPSFTTVLHVHEQAAKFCKDDEERGIIATESLEIMTEEWENDPRKERAEKLQQVALVLDCIGHANSSGGPFLIDEGDALIDRMLSEEEQDNIWATIEAGNPEGFHDVHIFNFLGKVAEFNASCPATKDRTYKAQQLLQFLASPDLMMENVEETVLPPVHAFNRVLDSSFRAAEHSNTMRAEDVDVAFSLLDSMVKTRHPQSRPNEDTYVSIFRILTAANLDDAGDRAEWLLESMEVWNALASPDAPPASLAMYHRALVAWQTCALKGNTGGRAFKRAMLLLERMEVQSMPLALTDKEVSRATMKSIYCIDLKPTRKTYKLILEIFKSECRGAADDDVLGLLVALFDGMHRCDLFEQHRDLRQMFTECLQCISEQPLADRERIEQTLQGLE